MRELYCDRLADRHLARWALGRYETGVCAECGEAVTAAPDPERRLVCIVCLTRESTDSEPLDVHPLNDPMHCWTCFEQARANGWSGTSDARLHSNWWGV